MPRGPGARRESEGDAELDVVCAGELSWRLSASRALEPGAGAASVALALARSGLRVGLAAVVPPDATGDRCLEKLAAAGVDVAGARRAPDRAGLVLVDPTGAANPRQVASDAVTLAIPVRWTFAILLLSGLSPHLPHAAALCRAARAARRKGSFVVLDADANLRAWAGRDPRTVHMLLREVDVARCSVADLAVLGMDARAMRAALRPSAILVVTDGVGGAIASGPFGEVAYAPREPLPLRAEGAGDASTAAICAELLRRASPGETPNARWHRALAAAHAAQRARSVAFG